MAPVARPPAKVNLSLAVSPRRADGFHELHSVVVRIGLCDGLRVSRLATGTQDRLEVEGDPETPISDNIVLRAARLLRAGHDVSAPPLPPLGFRLTKAIPMAAGLGGGSSDGAAALELAASAWRLQLDDRDRLELAARLGSDVPFFASDTPVAVLTGRGERIELLPALQDGLGVLLAVTSARLSTAAVFARFDDLPEPRVSAAGASEELAAVMRRGLDGRSLVARAPRLRAANDLWQAAVSLAPPLADARAALEERTGRAWLLSGSGPSLFALFGCGAEAADAGVALRATALPPVLADAIYVAVDLVGPDPLWRFP